MGIDIFGSALPSLTRRYRSQLSITTKALAVKLRIAS
jgi:hypothetical protein